VKGKVAPVLNLLSTMPWRRVREGGIAPRFLTSVQDGGEWLASPTSHFTHGERAPGTYWIGGSVDPGAGLDSVEKQWLIHASTDVS
jgi:hypothetical protein